MKFRIVTFLLTFFISLDVFAQETSLGELLDLESKVTKAKLNQDLAKVEPMQMVKPSELPKLDVPPPKKPTAIVPHTVAVFGIAPNYTGYMDFDGSVIPLKKGDVIYGKRVVDISTRGISLEVIPAQPRAKVSKSSKKKPKIPGDVKKPESSLSFYPISA